MSPASKFIPVKVILAVIFTVLETEPYLRDHAGVTAEITDIGFGIIFLVEYSPHLYAAGEGKWYLGILDRTRYAASPIALIDLLVLVPFMLTAGLADASSLRFVRLFRLLTLAKLGRYTTALRNIGTALYIQRYGLLASLLDAFVVMLMAASVLCLTEASGNPDRFGSTPRVL